MPVATRTAVVADTRPPTVLAPLQMGAADAVRALSRVQARGERATSDALTLVLRQLPETPRRLRVVVLYTSAPDAGGEVAAELAERLTKEHALLAVISTGTDTRYWSRVTAATGGLLVEARPSTVMAASDEVAAALRGRYVFTFQVSGYLPERVSVRVRTVDGTLTADAVVFPGREGTGGGARSGSGSEEPGRGGMGLRWLLVLGVGVLVVIAVAVFVMARRAWPRDGASLEGMLDGLVAVPGSTTMRGDTTWTEVCILSAGESPRRADRGKTVGAVARTSPGGEASQPGVHIFDLSDLDAPREVAYYAGQAEAFGRPSTGADRPRFEASTAAVTRTVEQAPPEMAPGGTAAAAPTSRPSSRSQAASAAAAVAAAEQRARAVAAATARAAADAAAYPSVRRQGEGQGEAARVGKRS
jgi:hypothetical protein